MRVITLGSNIKYNQSSEWDIGDFKPKILSGFTEPKPRPAAKFRRARTLYERRIAKLSAYERNRLEKIINWCSVVEGRAETLSLQLGFDSQYIERKIKAFYAFSARDWLIINTLIKSIEQTEAMVVKKGDAL